MCVCVRAPRVCVYARVNIELKNKSNKTGTPVVCTVYVYYAGTHISTLNKNDIFF